MDEISMARRQAIAAADLTLADILRTQAIVRPEATALVMGQVQLNYRDLDAVTERLAAGLVDLGLKRGDRLAVLSRNSLQFALLFHAAAKAGIAIAAMNWRSPAAELRKAILLAQPGAIAVADAQAALLDELAIPVPRILLDQESIGGPVVTFGDLKQAQPRPLEVRSEDIVSIVFTSGSTGDPKAVAISQRALIARASVIAIDWSLEEGDAFIGWPPLFHISSSDYLFTTVVLSGVFVVVDGFSTETIVHTVRSRKVGWLFLVPGTVERFLEALGPEPLPPRQVKVVGVMADLMAPNTMTRLCEVTGAPFLNSFGSTETGLLPCSPSFIRSGDTIGMNLPKRQSALCSIRLVDENGNDVAEGEPGEMWVRSQTLFSGYWNNDEATAKAFADRWYHSGDVLRRNADGQLQFVGRLSGMIKSGGENIYPAEIERALLSHPAVTEAAAVGVPDARWGETPHAFVSLADRADCSIDELKGFLRSCIAAYKIPDVIHVIGLADFPRNVTGKVDRKVLARRLNEAEGLK